MRADAITSEECYKTACKTRSWGPMAKEEIIKTLKEAADFVSRDGICLEFKGLNVFLEHDCIELRPLVSDRESLVFSYDTIKEVYFCHKTGSDRPCGLSVCTVYGLFMIVLEDWDGQA